MTAAVRETHISTLFLVGDRVYKLKKPVTTGFLDFSTREAREAACHREVELNRRLAPDVYLGVATVLDTAGEPCDHVVVMRRMPEERRLSTLVRAGDDVGPLLRTLARDVAAFHARAETGPEVAAQATGEALAAAWADNLAQMERFVGPVLDPGEAQRVAHRASAYVAGRGPLFARRIEQGWVRDGHGDLLADDIFWLDDGPRVLDCIEFDDHLRYGDVLADVAFLAMDLERLGRPDLGSAFLSWYGEFSGEHHPATLAAHYIAARALVRAKVACLRSEQGDAEAADEARLLHGMADRHLDRSQVVLVVVGGLPGTGKSTLAGALADQRGWALLRSDVVRKELVGLPATEPVPESYRAGLYSSEATSRTYQELLVRARALLEGGESVVVDASWTAGRHRRAARRVAAETASRLVELRCEAPREVTLARLAARETVGGDASDATPEIADAMAVDSDPWPEARGVDTTLPPDEAAASALAAIDGAVYSPV